MLRDARYVMGVIATIFGILGTFLLFNFLFALLYTLSKKAGNGFYRWITHDLEFLMILSAPLFGLTQLIASSIYGRFNWFVARVLLFLYAILVFVLAIVCFVAFGHFADMQ